jgi:hypothetical protein
MASSARSSVACPAARIDRNANSINWGSAIGCVTVVVTFIHLSQAGGQFRV